MELQSELARDLLNPPDQNYGKIGLLTQSYLNLFVPNLVFANRILLQGISEVNFQLLLPLGGNSTLRGLPQDRYLNSFVTLINSELRFPIWWRLGGVVGVDAGNGDETPDWII